MTTFNCCPISSIVAPGCGLIYPYFIKFLCPTLLDPLCEKCWMREDNPLVTDEYMSSLTVSYTKGDKTICFRFLGFQLCLSLSLNLVNVFFLLLGMFFDCSDNSYRFMDIEESYVLVWDCTSTSIVNRSGAAHEWFYMRELMTGS